MEAKLTELSPPPQCRVTSLPASMDEGRTVKAIRDWDTAEATRDAQTKRVLAKYIATVVR